MCETFSFIFHRSGRLFDSLASDSHSAIMRENGLNDNLLDRDFIRIECRPYTSLYHLLNENRELTPSEVFEMDTGTTTLEPPFNWMETVSPFLKHFHFHIDEPHSPSWLTRDKVVECMRACRERIKSYFVFPSMGPFKDGQFTSRILVLTPGCTHISATYCRFPLPTRRCHISYAKHCCFEGPIELCRLTTITKCELYYSTRNCHIGSLTYSSVYEVSNSLIEHCTGCFLSNPNGVAFWNLERTMIDTSHSTFGSLCITNSTTMVKGEVVAIKNDGPTASHFFTTVEEEKKIHNIPDDCLNFLAELPCWGTTALGKAGSTVN